MSASWTSSTVLMKCDWPRTKFVVSGLSIFTVMSSIAITFGLGKRGATEPHRQPSRSPGPGWPVEHARKLGAAAETCTARVELPAAELIPVALDEQRAAGRAPGAGPGRIVHVAGVNVAEPVTQRDTA